jgi:3-oxoacyl-[acyl-carrier-protein] synthase III
MVRARIIGTGSYTPRKILTNNDLAHIVDTSDEWIMTRTGIRERHVAGDGEATSTFAYQASLKALDMAGIAAGDLDMIIVGTVTPDMPTPSVACLLQHKLKAERAAALDVSAGCTGFLYALSVADSLIRAGNYSKILVIGAESLSRITDYTDRTTCILFGDGAGAVVLSREQGQHGILSTLLYADGSCSDLLYMPGGGSAHPASTETIAKRLHYLKMDGNKVFKTAVKALEDCVIQILEKNGLSSDQITLLISHQANLRIIQAIAKRLELPQEKVFVNIQKYGNTSSASVPIALDEANRQKRIKKNDLILMNAFGAGFTWGSALVRW